MTGLEVAVWDLGRQPYRAVLALQRALAEERKAGGGDDLLLCVEHEPVVTLGRRADARHVLWDAGRLGAAGVDLVAVERGGDVAYHGPGQLVLYPILDLRRFRKDVRWYSAGLLRVAVETVGAFGLTAEARTGAETGVWLTGRPRAKLGFLGVRIARWITTHGLALNVDPHMAHFEAIVPCGLPDVEVTSIARELGRRVSVAEVLPVAIEAFSRVFDVPVAARGGPERSMAALTRTSAAPVMTPGSDSDSRPAPSPV